MRTQEQMTNIVTRAMKDLHHDHARKWGIPIDVLAGATLGLGVTMLHESGYSEEQIVEIVRSLVGGLAGPPGARGAS
jgi:hypothetical protein